MDLLIKEKQVVSKKRITDHGEVYTNKREVNAMLDLVRQETERIESRFLEPACGIGKFLIEVLERKFVVVSRRYSKSQLEYERNAVLAVSSIYGIDILEDNVKECRKRLFDIFGQKYTGHFKQMIKKECMYTVKYILEKNIIWGDALDLKTVGENPQPIIFSEWSPINGSMFKRRDFTFYGLLDHKDPLISDLGEDAFISKPVKEYPPIHFLMIGYVQQQ